jgi:hypothetical protein
MEPCTPLSVPRRECHIHLHHLVTQRESDACRDGPCNHELPILEAVDIMCILPILPTLTRLDGQNRHAGYR